MNIDDLIAQESEKLAYLHFCPEVKLALETKTADLSQYRNSLIGAGAGGLAGAFHGYAKRRGSLKQALKDALIGALAGGGVGYATDVARGAGGLGLFDGVGADAGADAGQASSGAKVPPDNKTIDAVPQKLTAPTATGQLPAPTTTGNPYVDAASGQAQSVRGLPPFVGPPAPPALGEEAAVRPPRVEPAALDALDNRAFMERMGDRFAQIPYVGSIPESIPTDLEGAANVARSARENQFNFGLGQSGDIQRYIDTGNPTLDAASNYTNNFLGDGITVNPGASAGAFVGGVGTGFAANPLARAAANSAKGSWNKARQTARTVPIGSTLENANAAKNPGKVLGNLLSQPDVDTLLRAQAEVAANGGPSRIPTASEVEELVARNNRKTPPIVDVYGKRINSSTPQTPPVYSDPDAVRAVEGRLSAAEASGRPSGWKPAKKKPLFGGKKFRSLPAIAAALGTYYFGNNNTPIN